MPILKYAPLEVALIDEGRFAKQVEEAFRDVQERLVRYHRKHGDKAIGAVATIAATITLKVENGNSVSVKAQVKPTLPAPPASVSLSHEADDQTDRPGLFVQRTGSTAAAAEQGRLTTQEGEILAGEDEA